MMAPEAPRFPRCDVCDSRMNSWAIRVCMACQLLPTASVVQLADRRGPERIGA